MGFLVKLDTNGTNPAMIKKLIDKKLVDYIAMDVKAPLKKYEKVTGVKFDLSKIEKSIIIIKNSPLPYEFRTTIAPGLISFEDIKEIGKLIKGCELWYLQQFKPDADLINKDFEKIKPYSKTQLNKMCKEGQKYVKECKIR